MRKGETNMKGNAKLRKERELEIVNILIIAVLAIVFTLGVAVGKGVAIKDARLVEENSTSYVLSFGESEHLYLRDDVVSIHLENRN